MTTETNRSVLSKFVLVFLGAVLAFGAVAPAAQADGQWTYDDTVWNEPSWTYDEPYWNDSPSWVYDDVSWNEPSWTYDEPYWNDSPSWTYDSPVYNPVPIYEPNPIYEPAPIYEPRVFNDCYTYYGCGGYAEVPTYSSSPYVYQWDYDWGFEEETYEYEEYVYEWEYDWHFDDDDEYDACPAIPGDQPRGYNCHRDDDEPRCEIDAEDTTIEEGDSTRLIWESDDADEARINQGIGSVNLDGSRTVSPDEDTTYVLTVRDDDGDTDTCSVTIRVEEEEDDDDLRCELTVDDRTVDEGDEVTLEWDIEGDADYASINQGVGRVDEDGGEEEVEVDRDTTFRLTVRNDDGDEDTCSVTVRVDEENEFSSIDFEGDPVYNPPVVYLSDIPYTGLDDIDPAVLSFWVILIALAGAGTWFAYRMGFIPTFALATVEPIDEGHADEGVAEGHATEASPEASALLSALAVGNADGAIAILREAAVKGSGVEALLESASLAADDSVKARVDAALAASRMTGIRGAKEALGI